MANAKTTTTKRLPGTIQARSGRWEAGIQVNGRRVFLGTFDTMEEAHSAFLEAKEKYPRPGHYESTKGTELTAERLHELVDYNPDTGIFTLRPRPRSGLTKAHLSRPAGRSTPNIKSGYLEIKVNYVSKPAHIMAWLWMTGEWPPEGFTVDHRNTNRLDNRWSNLRLATKPQQSWNRPLRGKGATWIESRGKWKATITVNRKAIFLGYFATEEEARAAHVKAALEHHGEFVHHSLKKG